MCKPLCLRHQVILTLFAGSFRSESVRCWDTRLAELLSVQCPSYSFKQADVFKCFLGHRLLLPECVWRQLTTCSDELTQLRLFHIRSAIRILSDCGGWGVGTQALWNSARYLRGLRDLSHLLALALLRHALSILGPVDAPAHRQHALQGLSNWPSVNLFFLQHGGQNRSSDERRYRPLGW